MAGGGKTARKWTVAGGVAALMLMIGAADVPEARAQATNQEAAAGAAETDDAAATEPLAVDEPAAPADAGAQEEAQEAAPAEDARTAPAPEEGVEPTPVEPIAEGDAESEPEPAVLGTQEAGPDEPLPASAAGEAALDRGDAEGGEGQEPPALVHEEHLGVAEGEEPYVEDAAAAYESRPAPEAYNNYERSDNKWPLILTLLVAIAVGAIFAKLNRDTGPRPMPAGGHDHDHGGGDDHGHH